MRTCRACGGVLGRDCFNEQDCLAISASNNQYAEQLSRELDWERRVVVPDLEGKLSCALVAVYDLATMLLNMELEPEKRDFVQDRLQFYNDHIDHRKPDVSIDDNDLPF